MATDSPNFDIPPEMRDFAEKSVDQARKAFDGFMDAAHKAAGTVEGSTDVLHSGTKDLGRKALGYAEQNVSATLDFAARLVNARDPQEMAMLQAEFLRAQIAAFGEQMKDFGASAARLAGSATKPRK
jgi:phasin